MLTHRLPLLVALGVIGAVLCFLPNPSFSQTAPQAPKEYKIYDYVVMTNSLWIGIRKDGSGFVLVLEKEIRRELPANTLPYEAFKRSLSGEIPVSPYKYNYYIPEPLPPGEDCLLINGIALSKISGDLLRDHAIAALEAEKTKEADAVVARIREADQKAEAKEK